MSLRQTTCPMCTRRLINTLSVVFWSIQWRQHYCLPQYVISDTFIITPWRPQHRNIAFQAETIERLSKWHRTPTRTDRQTDRQVQNNIHPLKRVNQSSINQCCSSRAPLIQSSINTSSINTELHQHWVPSTKIFINQSSGVSRQKRVYPFLGVLSLLFI